MPACISHLDASRGRQWASLGRQREPECSEGIADTIPGRPEGARRTRAVPRSPHQSGGEKYKLAGKFLSTTFAFALALPLSAIADITVFTHLGVGYTHFGFDRTNDEQAMTDRARSRLGARLSTNINDSLRALAHIEWNIHGLTGGDRGEDTFVRRESYLGIGAPWGELTFGAHHSAFKSTGGIYWDPMVTTEFEQRRTGGMAGGQYGNSSFSDRIMQYRTPDIGGLRATLQLGLDSTLQQYAGQRRGNVGDVVASASYQLKTVELIAAAARIQASDRTIADNNNANYKLGVRWAEGAYSAALQYEHIGILEGAGRAAGIDHARGFNQTGFFTDTHAHIWLGGTYTRNHNTWYTGLAHANADACDEDVTTVTLALEHRPARSLRFYGGIQYARFDDAIGAGNDQLWKVGVGARYDFSKSFQ